MSTIYNMKNLAYLNIEERMLIELNNYERQIFDTMMLDHPLCCEDIQNRIWRRTGERTRVKLPTLFKLVRKGWVKEVTHDIRTANGFPRKHHLFIKVWKATEDYFIPTNQRELGFSPKMRNKYGWSGKAEDRPGYKPAEPDAPRYSVNKAKRKAWKEAQSIPHTFSGTFNAHDYEPKQGQEND